MKKQLASKSSAYKYIAAWGSFMGSFSYYIKMQQELALQESAPVSAIYKKQEGGWFTFEEIQNETAKEAVLYWLGKFSA